MKAEIKIIFSKEEVIDLIKAKLQGVETYGPGEFRIDGRWTSIPGEIVAEFVPSEQLEVTVSDLRTILADALMDQPIVAQSDDDPAF